MSQSRVVNIVHMLDDMFVFAHVAMRELKTVRVLAG